MRGAVGEKPKPRPPTGNDYIDFAVAQLRRMDYPDAANGLYDAVAAAEERGRRRGLEECTPALLEARYWFAANAMPVKAPREAVIARINAALAPRDSAPKKHKCMRCGGEFECSTDGCEPRDSGKVEP